MISKFLLDILKSRKALIKEFKQPLLFTAALITIITISLFVRCYIALKFQYHTEPSDYLYFQEFRGALHQQLLRFDVLLHYAIGMGTRCVLSASQFAFIASPIACVWLMVAVAALAGVVASGYCALCAALFAALVPALVEPQTLGVYDSSTFGLPLVVSAALCYALAVRESARRVSLWAVAAALCGACALSVWHMAVWLLFAVCLHVVGLLMLGVLDAETRNAFGGFALVWLLVHGGAQLAQLTLENALLFSTCGWLLASLAVRARHWPYRRAIALFYCVALPLAWRLGVLPLSARAQLLFGRPGLGWLALFRVFHVTLFTIPAGFHFCLTRANSVLLFVLSYGVVALTLVSLTESAASFAAPPLVLCAALGFCSVARGFLLPHGVVSFRNRERAVSRESMIGNVVFLCVMAAFFFAYTWSSAMSRVVERPSLSVTRLQPTAEALETVEWLRRNTNSSLSTLVWPSGSTPLVLRAANRSFVVRQHRGARVRGTRFHAAAVLLADEERAHAAAKQLGVSFVLARCSPLDTAEYSTAATVDSNADFESLAHANVALQPLTSAELRFAQLATDSRFVDDMRAEINTVLQELNEASANGNAEYKPKLLKAAKATQSTDWSFAALHLMCGARATKFHSLYSSVRGQYRVLKVGNK